METPKLRQRGARFLLIAASLVVVIAGLRAAGQILLPLLVAIFLSILSYPLLDWLRRHRVPKLLAVTITVLANMAVVAAIVSLVSGSINAFTRSLPRYQVGLERKAGAVVEWLESHGIDTSELAWVSPPEPVVGGGGEDRGEGGQGDGAANTGAVARPGTEAERPTQFNANSVVDLVTSTLRGLAYLLSNTMLVLLMMVFLLFEASGLPRKLQRAFAWEDEELARLLKTKVEIQRYLGIKTLISLATGVVITIWVTILGVEYPLLWGLVAFLFNYIPSLGSIIAAIPPVVLTIIDVDLGHALAVGLGYLVVNIVLGNFAEPHLMGRRFGLSTLVVFISLVFWGWLWGPVGMLLSVPLTMVLKILLENTQDLRWLALLLGANPPPPAPTN